MNKTLVKHTLVRLPAMLALMLAAAGCLQLELTVEMHEKDAGATVTERIRFSQALQRLDEGGGGKIDLASYLGRQGALNRMKRMGKGVELVNHAENKLTDGSRESVSVYRIPDIEDLRLPNPFVQNNRPAPLMRFNFGPVYERRSGGDRVGTIGLNWRVAEGQSGPKAEEEEDWLPESPLDFQVFRDLQPVFADMMSDFEVKVVVIVPGQPAERGRPAGNRTLTLLHFNDRHTDRHAEPLIRNEEAMLSMLQLKLGDAPITEHTRNFPRYEQVPVHRGRSNYGSTGFVIWPTRHLFRKYFAGRPKSQGGDQ